MKDLLDYRSEQKHKPISYLYKEFLKMQNKFLMKYNSLRL